MSQEQAKMQRPPGWRPALRWSVLVIMMVLLVGFCLWLGRPQYDGVPELRFVSYQQVVKGGQSTLVARFQIENLAGGPITYMLDEPLLPALAIYRSSDSQRFVYGRAARMFLASDIIKNGEKLVFELPVPINFQEEWRAGFYYEEHGENIRLPSWFPRVAHDRLAKYYSDRSIRNKAKQVLSENLPPVPPPKTS